MACSSCSWRRNKSPRLQSPGGNDIVDKNGRGQRAVRSRETRDMHVLGGVRAWLGAASRARGRRGRGSLSGRAGCSHDDRAVGAVVLPAEVARNAVLEEELVGAVHVGVVGFLHAVPDLSGTHRLERHAVRRRVVKVPGVRCGGAVGPRAEQGEGGRGNASHHDVRRLRLQLEASGMAGLLAAGPTGRW